MNKREQLVFASLSRATGWSKGQLLNSESLKTFKEGALPLINPENHEFKTREKGKEIHSMSVYVKSYKTAARRAEDVSEDFRNTHLEPGPYAGQTYFLEKPRIQEKELGSDFRFGGRSESERLFKHLNSPHNRLLDPSPRDNTMLIEPKWKEIDKEKWVAKRDFDLTSCHYRGRRSSDPWETVQGGINIGDPYTEGFEVTGDIGRQRSREREVSPKDFVSTINSSRQIEGRYSLPPVYGASIRSSKASKFFNHDEKSKSVKFYPQTLKHVLSSGDRIVSEYPLSPNDMTPVPKFISITANNEVLTPMQELALITQSRSRIKDEEHSSEFGDNSVLRKSYARIKKMKNLKKANRPEYIRQTVKSYFA